MKGITRIISILTAVFVLTGLIGCNSQKNEPAKDSQYYKKDFGKSIGLENILCVKMNSNNQLVLVTQDQKVFNYRTVDIDGKTISDRKCELAGDGSVFTVDSRDNLYILSQNTVYDKATFKITENKRELIVLDEKGEKTKTLDLGKVTQQKDEIIYVQSMAVDSKGNIYLQKNNENLEVCDPQGKTVESKFKGKYSPIVIDDSDNVYAGIMGAKGGVGSLEKIDSSTGKTQWKKDLEIGTYVMSSFYNQADKCLYTVTNKGIDRYEADGNKAGQIFDFMKYGLIKDGLNVASVCVDKDKNLYIHATDYSSESAKSQFLEFTTNPNLPGVEAASKAPQEAKDKKVINLAAHFSDRWLEAAVSAYQSEHPEVEIKIKDYKGAYYGDGDTPEEAHKRAEDFVKMMNTDLMAGKGPDIIYFGELPYRKYVDKNLFYNLSEAMAKDKSFNPEDLNMNILNALKYKGNVYIMPINYQFQVLVGSKSIIDKEKISIDDKKWTWDDYKKIVESLKKDTNNDGEPDQYAMSNPGDGIILDGQFNDNYSRFIDMEKKTANFDCAEFIKLLKDNKAFREKKLFFDSKDWAAVTEKTARGGIVFNHTGMAGYGMLYYFKNDVYKSDINVYRLPSNQPEASKSIRFSTGNAFAISNTSKYKDEAWELLKALVSEKQQSSYELQNGLPINNKALVNAAKFSVEKLKVPQEYVDKVNEIIPEVKTCIYSDPQLDKIIKEEMSAYFDGKKTAEDAAKTIQTKVTTFLGE